MISYSPKSPNLKGMDISIDFNNTMADRIGTEHGITCDELEGLDREIAKPDGFHDQLQSMRKAGKLQFAELPYDADMVERINNLAESMRGEFENFVLLGMGGSVLGPIALHAGLNHPPK